MFNFFFFLSKHSTRPQIYFHFPVQKFLCLSSPFKNPLNILSFLGRWWEKSLANIRLHIFVFYVEAEGVFWGLLCLQKRLCCVCKWRQGEFSSLRKYVTLVFASFRKIFICTSTLPKILLFKSEMYIQRNWWITTDKNITNSILIDQ